MRSASYPRFGPHIGRFDEVLGAAGRGLSTAGPSLAELRVAAQATEDPLVMEGVEFLEQLGLDRLLQEGIWREARSYREIFAYPDPPLFEQIDAIDHDRLRFHGEDTAPEGLALYVDIPFCDTACRFCFTVGRNTRGDRAPVLEHLNRIEREARLFVERFDGFAPRVACLYVGGGTGSYLELDEMERLLGILRSVFEMPAGTPMSCEGSPNTMRGPKVAGLLELGFDAISFGVESFEDHLLSSCNRAHDAALAEQSIVEAMQAGMAHTNIDLILGLPNQSFADALRTIETVGRLRPGALQLYSLRVLPHTAFWRADERLMPTSAVVYLMQAVARRYLVRAGYHRSAGTRWVTDPTFSHAQHAHTYDGLSGLGLGPRGASYFPHLAFTNTRSIAEYARELDAGRLAVRRVHETTTTDRLVKSLVMPLKLREGLDADRFRQKTGLEVMAVFGPQLRRLEALGLAEVTTKGWALTEAGALFETEALRDTIGRYVASLAAAEQA